MNAKPLLLAALLGGCATTPHNLQQDLAQSAIPAAWMFQNSDRAANSHREWWRDYGSADLDQLIPCPQPKPCRRGLCLAKKPHRAGKQRRQPGRRLQRRRERQRRAQPQPRRPQQPKLRQQPRHQLPGRPLGQTAPCQRQRRLGKPGHRRRPARHPLKPHRRHHQPIPANRFTQRPTGAERRLPQKRRTNPRPHPHQSSRRQR